MTSYESFERFIETSGLSDYFKGDRDLELRLYHDLGIYGDIAESYIETLRDNCNVDVTDFVFSDYFPEEFAGKNQLQKIIFSLVPFIRSKVEDRKGYKPLTFLMLKDAIRKGKLV
jgi:hypothetical protein